EITRIAEMRGTSPSSHGQGSNTPAFPESFIEKFTMAHINTLYQVKAGEIYEWWGNHHTSLESVIREFKELKTITDSLEQAKPIDKLLLNPSKEQKERQRLLDAYYEKEHKI
ncbi:hypothetical protein IWQ61_010045, partial [Dispira simplex]